MAIRFHATEPPGGKPKTNQHLYDACWRGEEPAELLSQRDRENLVYELWTQRWTVVQIATHTRMSTYTTQRICDRLGLESGRQFKEVAA